MNAVFVMGKMGQKTGGYSNLFAVCLGKGGLPIDLHCDTKKAQFNSTNGLPIKINPSIEAHISTIKYSSTGLLSSRNSSYNNEIHQILNLNISYLKEMRQSKWAFLFKYSYDKTGEINKEKMRRLLEKDLSRTKGQFNNHFPGMCEYLLKKHC